ncbi:GntR family transcriptional regulator [Streptomyces sp. NPDC093248]|uniref:GntR family transcriptional regulator n=1 Tax=Streptomyces sp. NPDC093248 TaxID=3155072 RepID=UPI00342C97E7
MKRSPTRLFAVPRDRIPDGGPPPGSALGAEREPASEFGVNRHAVRAAVERLQQARRVQVRPGDGHSSGWSPRAER